MASHERRADRGRGIGREIRSLLGGEIRAARLQAGLSQASAGRAADMSHAQFGRIERAELRHLTVDQVARAASAVGLRVTARCYPDGDPIRDAAQLALLERLRVRLPAGVRFRTEVALPLPGDQRAWDAVAVFADGRAAIEAETRIRDIQALERRISLKQRDGAVDLVVLLVAGTDANRRTLATHRELLRDAFPLDSRVILAAFESGHTPPGNGIVIL